jgi:hypothetical protein
MTNSASLSKVRSALLATAAIAGLAFAPSAANATSYALTAVDVENLQFTGINAFVPNFSFVANSSSNGTALASSSHTAAGTTVSLTADLQDTRTSSGTVALGDLGFAPQSAGALPAQGPGGNYSTSQSAITSTATNFAAGANSFGSWRGTAEASVNGQGGNTEADSTSQQRLVWGLTLNPNPAVLHLDFDVSFLAAANVTGSNLNGTATSSYVLQLAFTGAVGPNQPTDFLTVLNTTTPNPQTNADLNVGIGCTKAASGAIAGDTHIHCDFAVANSLNPPDQLTLTDTETVTVTAAAVPEPATLGLMGMGLLGLGAAARRRAKKAA